MGIAGQDCGGGFGAPSGEAGVAVGAVADDGEVVGDGCGRDAEFGDDAGFVAHDVLAAIELDDAGADDTLAEIFVGRADEDLGDACVLRCFGGSCGEGVIGFEFDHGPDFDAHGFESFFKDGKLGEQLRRHAFAGFVAGIEIVAEGFDDVIGGDAEVGCAGFDHRENRRKDTADGADFPAVCVFRGRDGEEVAEEFVGAVDEVRNAESTILRGRLPSRVYPSRHFFARQFAEFSVVEQTQQRPKLPISARSLKVFSTSSDSCAWLLCGLRSLPKTHVVGPQRVETSPKDQAANYQSARIISLRSGRT